MKFTKQQLNRKGSALILVIVVTVLLAAIAALFILMARVSSMASSSADTERGLDSAVNTVLDQIEEALLDGLFSGSSLDSYATYNGWSEYDWLSTVEPDINDCGTPADDTDDYLVWNKIPKLWGNLNLPTGSNWYDPASRTDATYWNDTQEHIDDIPIDDSDKIISRIVDDRFSTEIIIEGGDWTDSDDVLDYGAVADADGDGVADSRWMRVPGVRTSKGKRIYAAVRIVDNNAMLNLNTAHSIGDTDDDYYGKYLSEVDFSDFLRGYDRGYPERIQIGRKEQDWSGTTPDIDTFADYHDNAIMNIESLDYPYTLFDISDELEIRNRFMLTSNTISLFEKNHWGDDLDTTTADEQPNGVFPDFHGIGYYTFDYGRGDFVASGSWWATKSKRIPVKTTDDYESWVKRLNHDYWGLTSYGDSHDYAYDRRHVCTFYSFDRNIRSEYPNESVFEDWPGLFAPEAGVADVRGIIPNSYNDDDILEARANVVHLLYALRAYYIQEHGVTDKKVAAKKSAQYVVNMIDYLDQDGEFNPFYDPNNSSTVNGVCDQKPEEMTYLNDEIISHITALVAGTDAWETSISFKLDSTEVLYGYEAQPFITEIVAVSNGLALTKVSFELYNPYSEEINLDNWRISIGSNNYDIPSGFKVDSEDWVVIESTDLTGFDLTLGGGTDPVELQRQCPDDNTIYLTVDKLETDQTSYMLSPSVPGTYTFVSARVNTGSDWEFTNNQQHTEYMATASNSATLGSANSTSDTDVNRDGYQLPVADGQEQWGTLVDLIRVPLVGNDSDGCITEYVADAGDEGDIHYDYDSNPKLFNYISLFERDNGRIPGRINVNNAIKEVIMAAIPPSVSGTDWDPEAIADAIIEDRPFSTISDIYTSSNTQSLFQTYGSDPNDNVGGSYSDDFEERDWLTSLVFNKFTVRSDVFSAYIVVRLGVDGPEKRVFAIFDRSRVYGEDDKPELVALHVVPDPR